MSNQKIGLYGSSVNNMYHLSRCLSSAGLNAVYCFDKQKFCCNHPFWWHESIVLRSEEYLTVDFMSALGSTPGAEDSFFRRLNIHMPSSGNLGLKQFVLVFLLVLRSGRSCFGFLVYLLRNKYRADVVNFFSGNTVNIVCGVEGAILANLSGKPYIIVPHGADIRLANGYSESIASLGKLSQSLLQALTQRAFQGAVLIASHDPACFLTPSIPPDRTVRNLIKPNSSLSIGFDIPSLRDDAKPILEELLGFAIDQQKIVLIPTSIEYQRKRIDWVVEWIELNPDSEFVFIFLGWGRDYQDCFNRICRFPNVVFLHYFISSPLIHELMSSATLLIDSFGEPGYGTAFLEAAALKTPILGWVDFSLYSSDEYAEREPPPIFNCATKSEFGKSLQLLESMSSDQLRESGNRLYEWYLRNHGLLATGLLWKEYLIRNDLVSGIES